MSDKPVVIWDDEAGPLTPIPSALPDTVEWEAGGPPPPPKSDSFFAAYNPLRALAEKVSPLLTAPLQKAFQFAGKMDVRAGIKTPEQAESRAGTYSKLIVPQTQTDWALAGAFPAGRALSPLVTKGPTLQRMLTGTGTMAAGGAASQAEQGTPLPGLIQGAIAPVVGALPAAAGYVTKGTQWGKQKVLQSMERELASDMAGASPAFRGLKTGEDMYRQLVVFTKPIRDRFSQMFSDKLDDAALRLAPGNTVTSPKLIEIWKQLPKKDATDLATKQGLAPIEDKFTIYQAQELLDIARTGAYRGPKLALEKASSERVAGKFRAARDEAFASLPRDAAGAWQEARIMHGVNRGLLALFKEGGAMRSSGPLGPRLDPNKALDYLEKNAETLANKLGDDTFAVLHAALSRGGKLGERHETGIKELVPGILERSVVITRSILKHLGVSPTTWAGTRQPFAPGAGMGLATGLLAGQAGQRSLPKLEERREFIQ